MVNILSSCFVKSSNILVSLGGPILLKFSQLAVNIHVIQERLLQLATAIEIWKSLAAKFSVKKKNQQDISHANAGLHQYSKM